MARESCNLDKEEAELLKPSSPSSPATTSPAPVAATPPPIFLKPSQEPLLQSLPEAPAADPAACDRGKRPGEEEVPPLGRSGSRCNSCRKRVGVTGFRCRCGDLFCARHRHANAHDCSFDYKAAGREEISRSNPLIRPAKIIKI